MIFFYRTSATSVSRCLRRFKVKEYQRSPPRKVSSKYFFLSSHIRKMWPPRRSPLKDVWSGSYVGSPDTSNVEWAWRFAYKLGFYGQSALHYARLKLFPTTENSCSFWIRRPAHPVYTSASRWIYAGLSSLSASLHSLLVQHRSCAPRWSSHDIRTQSILGSFTVLSLAVASPSLVVEFFVSARPALVC